MMQCPALCWGPLEGALGPPWGANSFNTTPALQHRVLLLPTVLLLLLTLNTMWILKTKQFPTKMSSTIKSDRFGCWDLSCGLPHRSSVRARCYVAFHILWSLCISSLVEPIGPHLLPRCCCFDPIQNQTTTFMVQALPSLCRPTLCSLGLCLPALPLCSLLDGWVSGKLLACVLLVL